MTENEAAEGAAPAAGPEQDWPEQDWPERDDPEMGGTGLPELPYGSWPSPITAAQIAAGRVRVGFPRGPGAVGWWQEHRRESPGRTTIMRAGADGTPQELLPAPWSARTRVHEYGGQSYLPVPGPGGTSAFVFANLSDQRLYLALPGIAGSERPAPLTPEPAPAAADPRSADFALSPARGEIWCVRAQHRAGKVSRAIVAVPLDGSACSDPARVRILVSGYDFFAYPTPSPDGRYLAWICWNHPHMPWDGTELRVAPVEDGKPGKSRLLKGSGRESVLAPLWRDTEWLYVATDWTGWWNIYAVGLSGQPPRALYPAEAEFADPLWQLGGRPFALLADGRLAVRHGQGGARLALLDPETSELTDAEIPFTVFADCLSADGLTVAGIGGSPTQPQSVVRLDTATGGHAVLRAELDEIPDRRFLPEPEQAELEGPYGRTVHALVFPPKNPEVKGPSGELPPFIVWVHGGPTSHVTERLSMEKAYFTSRGIGIIDVNYGGSSGYGRFYRNRLHREWGVVDVADAMAAARSLARAGVADGARLGIRGGSAGGWTALAAVTTGAAKDRVFSAAVSYYGIADLRALAEHTHDFESRYLDELVGPLPAFDSVYAERAPLGHINANTCAVLILQGLDDPVVPPAQSEAIAADLAAHGIRHAYLAFEGESHGFRRTETMIAALEAELSFYGQIMGFEPGNVAQLKISGG